MIRTNGILDRETKSSYWLTVYAQDSGTVSLSAMLHVYIEVTDINDNIPQTYEPVYSPAVPENSPANTSVLQLSAYDLDGSTNSQLTYRITSGNPQGFFHIDLTSGEQIAKSHCMIGVIRWGLNFAHLLIKWLTLVHVIYK